MQREPAVGRLGSKLATGSFLLGTHVHSNDPTMTELLGSCGFDYIWIDTEHTAIDYHTLQLHLIAAKAAGCPAIVRVPWNASYLVKRVLDQGPDGIVFPMIRSLEEAKAAVASCFYPDVGSRSFGPIRAARYGQMPIGAYLQEENAPAIFLQVEHIAAVRALDEILGIPGLTGIILGPCDLSFSMGKCGRTDDPAVIAEVDGIIARCRERNVPVGVSLGDCTASAILEWKERGIRFVSTSSEYGFIRRGSTEIVSLVKGGHT